MYKNNRIYFDAVRAGDAETLQQFYNDYDLQAGIENTSNFLTPSPLAAIEEDLEGKGFKYVVKLLSTNEIIGYTSAYHNWVARAFEPMFYLDRSHRNKGYGLEILELCLHIAFMEMNANKVKLTIFSFNVASLKNAERCGFKQEGRHRDEVFRKGDYYDVLHMGLMVNEWQPKIMRPNMKWPIEAADSAKDMCNGCVCEDCNIREGIAEDPDDPGTYLECEGCDSCEARADKSIKDCSALNSYNDALLAKEEEAQEIKEHNASYGINEVCPHCGGSMETIDELNGHEVCDTCNYEVNVLGVVHGPEEDEEPKISKSDVIIHKPPGINLVSRFNGVYEASKAAAIKSLGRPLSEGIEEVLFHGIMETIKEIRRRDEAARDILRNQG